MHDGLEPRTPRAAIVDELSLTDSGTQFVMNAARELQDAGYAVDYYDPKQVTVDFYRNLPHNHYDLIIIRGHSSGVIEQSNQQSAPGSQQLVSLFTNEIYRPDAHVDDQLAHRLDRVRIVSPRRSAAFFGVTPEFVRHGMQGDLRGARIILMGCGGMSNTGMAKALSERGASVVIGWAGSVTAERTDATSVTLLHHLLADGETGPNAVARTMGEIGPDPAYQSKLVAYP